MNHPPLLIADEPTGNLDPETSIGIMQLLYRINQTGSTVLVATHDVAMVDKMRRRVIELSEGQDRARRAGRRLRRQREHARVRHPDAERARVRPVFFLREALRALKRNAIPSFAAMATVLVTVLVLGVFLPVVQATTGAANEVRAKVIADVYLKPDVKKADIDRVGRLLKAEPLIKDVVYISKEQALRTEKKRNPKAYALLGSNPLPDSYRITPVKPDDIAKIKDALAPQAPGGGTTTVDPAIDEVRNREEDTNKILSVTRVVKITMALLLGLLGVASVLLIANTIRLSLYARRREVEVMKLVGATDWFIRWPFVLEGVIVGAAGGLLAVLLLVVAKIAIVDPLAQDFALIAAPDTIDFRLLIGLLLLSGVAVSALGSGLSLRKFLRVYATHEHRDIVAALAGERRGLVHARGDPRRAFARRRAQQRLQAGQAVGVAGRARLGHAVREQHQRLVGRHLEVDVEQLRVLDPAEHGAGPADVLDRARAAHDHRHRVPGAADRRPRGAVELDAAERDRAVAPALRPLGDQRAVDDVQHAAGCGLVARRGAHGVAHERRQRGRPRALAGDVADHEVDAAVVGQHVVEVAADQRAVARGPEAGGQLDAVELRQPLRQQRGLQRPRDAAEILVQPRVVQRQRRAPGEVLGQQQVLGAVAAPRVQRGEDDDPDRAPARLQRHQQRRRREVGLQAPRARRRRAEDVGAGEDLRPPASPRPARSGRRGRSGSATAARARAARSPGRPPPRPGAARR